MEFPRLTALLDHSIDEAAIDGRKTSAPRLILAAVTGGFLTANFDWRMGLVWFLAGMAFEAWGWAVTRRIRPLREGTVAERLSYILAVFAMTANWTAVPTLYWLSERRELQVVGVVAACAQLIHAQAFTFRSRIVLAVNGGIPAAALLVLPLSFGHFSGAPLYALIVGLVMTLLYVAASAKANIDTTNALANSREELEKIAYHDALTSLANRRMFGEDLRRLMAYSRRHGTRFALLLIDLDRFKEVNDTLGHDAGDALLMEAAIRLQGAVRETDRVARVGGDEFGILLAEAGDHPTIELICKRIIESFGATVEYNGSKMSTTPSVGVAIYPEDGPTPENLYKAADLALYDAKNGGRNTWRYRKDLAA